MVLANKYINVSMGVASEIGSVTNHGGLLKFVNTLFVYIEEEWYENAGAYSLDHSIELLGKIHNRDGLGALVKSTFRDEYNWVYFYFCGDGFDIMEMPFYINALSTSLIVSHRAGNLRIGKENTFINVWLIDR